MNFRKKWKELRWVSKDIGKWVILKIFYKTLIAIVNVGGWEVELKCCSVVSYKREWRIRVKVFQRSLYCSEGGRELLTLNWYNFSLIKDYPEYIIKTTKINNNIKRQPNSAY